jgi:hypothetical protein
MICAGSRNPSSTKFKLQQADSVGVSVRGFGSLKIRACAQDHSGVAKLEDKLLSEESHDIVKIGEPGV